MAENSYFLVGSGTDGWTPATFEGRPVVSCYDALCEVLRGAGAAEAAALFAEPLTTWGNGSAKTKISWYGSRDGEAVGFDKLAGPARSAAEVAIRTAFAPLQAVLADPDLRPLVAAALELPSLGGLLLVGGSPILVYWGFRPERVQTPAEIAAHRQALFGDLLPWLEGALHGAPDTASPPLPRTVPAPAAALGGAASGAALEAATSSSAPSAPSAAERGADEPDRPAAAWWGRPWVPLAAAVVLLALLLLVLMIPGVLIRPGEAGPDFDLALRKEINRSLEERLALLQAAGTDGQCRTEEATRLLPLAPTTPAATRPAPPSGPATAIGAAPAPSSSDTTPAPTAPPATPPRPAEAAAPAETASTASLLNELDAATVLVLATGGTEASVGSAFYVNPRQLVTNLHVVEKAGADGLFVISQALRTPRAARIVARSAGSEIGQADFAVVEVAGEVSGKALRLTETVDRLQNVVAAGFPAVIMETDAEFQRLRDGDAAAIPQMAVTQGVVTAVQPQAQGLGIVAHTATISPGNSGGPLVDSCGRVVGVNTFGRSDASSALRLNYALLAGSLHAFLDRSGITHQTGAGACRPAEVSDASAGQAGQAR